VQQPGALVGRGAPPGAVERGACGFDRAVDVGLAGHRGPAERLAGGRLGEVAELARGRLDGLPVDEEAELAACRHRHEPENTG